MRAAIPPPGAPRPGAAPYAVTASCTGCGACLRTCPEHAVRPADSGPLLILAALCTGCGECVEICPADAIHELEVPA